MVYGSTTNELFRQGLIPVADVHAAADAFLANPQPSLHPLGTRYHLDIAAAVRADELARRILHDPGSALPAKQAAVRTAILLAQPRTR